MTTPTIQDALKAIRPLTDAERQDAADKAKANIIRQAVGSEPTPEQFKTTTAAKYPTGVMVAVGVLLALVFIGTVMLELFIMFSIGRDYFMHGSLAIGMDATEIAGLKGGINDAGQGILSGLATFLLGMFLVILSTVAARVFYEGNDRGWFAIPIVLGLTMTLVGNWTVKQPHDAFSWLLVVVPTVANLFLSLVGERLLFVSIENKLAAGRAYESAKAAYDVAKEKPDALPGYRQAFANALREMLTEVNKRGRGATERAELMSLFNGDIWRALVMREFSAGDWLEASDVVAVSRPAAMPLQTAPAPQISAPVVDKPQAPITRQIEATAPEIDTLADTQPMAAELPQRPAPVRRRKAKVSLSDAPPPMAGLWDDTN